MKKRAAAFCTACLILAALVPPMAAFAAGPEIYAVQNGGSGWFNTRSSCFERYENGQTGDAYTVKGRVLQENDGNAVALCIRAEQDMTLHAEGMLTRCGGGETRLVYRAPDGTETTLADGSAGSWEAEIPLSKGIGSVVFLGESAVYDFELRLALAEGVRYSDLRSKLEALEPELQELSAVPLIEDCWPERIGREQRDTVAENLSFALTLEEPAELMLSCVTEKGTLGMRIEGPDGMVLFESAGLETGEYPVTAPAAGTCRVTVQAAHHTGSFWLRPNPKIALE